MCCGVDAHSGPFRQQPPSVQLWSLTDRYRVSERECCREQHLLRSRGAPGSNSYLIYRREKGVLLKIPRGDIDELGEEPDDDDVYYYIRWRLKLEGETENMGVCTKERKGVTAAVLMATPCTNSLGGESGGDQA